ncbi:subclass B3 metallo-beta-lactamase [uncultured Mucilaginibacter sp.]|uniref:subclass B3 metallo-beta-lactamase n=1 Tax=uncultured Mucilaginibacter sp. TaxID=797541 RepID=UPI0025E77043|nr:subclass B3 metallo-beta-lactamase [uncultured Mucilaginibacter sp.]
MKAQFKSILMVFCLMSTALFVYPQQIVKLTPSPEWSKAYPPFRIVGNLYYVGTYELTSYLIVTPKGNILINTGLPGSENMIRSQVEKLGFKFSDIKLLLTNQVHSDHVGAMAAIKKMTGAKIMVNEQDAQELADGGQSDYVLTDKSFFYPPVKADVLLHEHDTIKFGRTQIVALHHPGHTRGATSFLFDVQDGHRSYRVLIANMPSIVGDTKLSGMPTYPNVGKDFAYTLKAMKNIKFDIWLAAHASQFDLHKKHKPGDPYNPDAFRNQKGYDAALRNLNNAYLKNLSQ